MIKKNKKASTIAMYLGANILLINVFVYVLVWFFLNTSWHHYKKLAELATQREAIIISVSLLIFTSLTILFSWFLYSKWKSEILENRFYSVINEIPDLVWMKDENGVYLTCNKKFEHFYGAPSSKIIGKTDYDFVDKEQADFFREKDLGAIFAGKPVSNEEWLIFPDDGYRGLFETIKTPVFDSEGKLQGVLGISRDITAHKKLTEELLSEKEFNQTLVQQSPLFFVSIGADGKILLMNDKMLKALGYTSQEVIGLDYVSTFVPEEDREGLVNIFGQIVIKKEFPVHINKILARDGRKITCEWHGIPIFNGEGKNFFIGIGVDITERLQAEKELEKYRSHLEALVDERTAELNTRTIQLEETNKELEFFSYSVSHDLRAPLRGIDGWSLALEEDYGPQLDQKAQGYINHLRTEAQRMSVLIDDLLKLAKITLSEVKLREVNLSALAETVAKRLKEQNPNRELNFVIEPNMVTIGDQNFLEIVLTNLLSNACKFTSKIEVAKIEFGQTSIKGESVYFVRDNGVGFNMSMANKLFVTFQRLHTQTDFPGTGVGLAIVKRIINIHNGSIWAESAVNHGAVFYFTLNKKIQVDTGHKL